MFLINKVNGRRPSRDLNGSENFTTRSNCTTTMDYPYLPECLMETPRAMIKRRSRGKSGFFGNSSGRSSSVDQTREQVSSRPRMTEKENLGLISLGKKKLRNVASKASLSSTSSTFEDTEKRPLGLRRVPESWGRKLPFSSAPTSPVVTLLDRDGKLVCPISSPFNFEHISHADRRDFTTVRQSTPVDLGRDYGRFSQFSPSSDGNVPTSPTNNKKKKKPSPLTRAVLRSTGSSASLMSALRPSQSLESLRVFSPSSPPRSHSEQTQAGKGEYVVHAVTTPDDTSYGRKSPGVERLLREHIQAAGYFDSTIPEEDGEQTPKTPDGPIPELFETLATPPHPENMTRARRISRMRPLSQISDIGESDFIVPGSPLLPPAGAQHPKRTSRRTSVQQMQMCGLGIMEFNESWEKDIDYSYEHCAESYCNFEWDKSSHYAVSTYGKDDDDTVSPISPISTPFSQDNFLKVPERRHSRCSERRITGQFEADLILPSKDEPEFDSENGILLRAANTALRHRSPHTSKSLGDLLTAKGFCEELDRVAEELNYLRPEEPGCEWDEPHPGMRLTLPLESKSPKRPPMRHRTDSDATCVTLCSDSDTITPIESGEAITPPNSTHNSFALHRIASCEDIRVQKGLSFPASAIPGVIEFAPEIHSIPLEGEEYVTYI